LVMSFSPPCSTLKSVVWHSLKYNEMEFWVIYTNFVNLGRKMINITTPGNEESLRKWFIIF
jgi:hypothetical protein